MSPAIVTVVTSRAQVEGGLTLFLSLHTCARGNNDNNRTLLHEAQHGGDRNPGAALWLQAGAPGATLPGLPLHQGRPANLRRTLRTLARLPFPSIDSTEPKPSSSSTTCCRS